MSLLLPRRRFLGASVVALIAACAYNEDGQEQATHYAVQQNQILAIGEGWGILDVFKSRTKPALRKF